MRHLLLLYFFFYFSFFSLFFFFFENRQKSTIMIKLKGWCIILPLRLARGMVIKNDIYVSTKVIPPCCPRLLFIKKPPHCI